MPVFRVGERGKKESRFSTHTKTIKRQIRGFLLELRGYEVWYGSDIPGGKQKCFTIIHLICVWGKSLNSARLCLDSNKCSTWLSSSEYTTGIKVKNKCDETERGSFNWFIEYIKRPQKQKQLYKLNTTQGQPNIKDLEVLMHVSLSQNKESRIISHIAS